MSDAADATGVAAPRRWLTADRARQAAFILGMGMAGVMLAAMVPAMSAKNVVFGGVALGGMVGLLILGRPKEVLLAAFILALTYNRQFFSFEWLMGPEGSRGLYWVPGDVPLLMLAVVQLAERALGVAERPALRVPAALVAWPAMAFLVPCVISMLVAERPDWAFADLVRVVKFTLIVVWLQATMTRSMWWTAIATLGASVLIQSALGVLQVALRADRSLLSAVGLGTDAVLVTESGEIDTLENRARGTLAHPNFLAPYLLGLLPALLGVVLYSRIGLVRLLAALVLMVGIAGMVATKSRAPIALTAVALSMVTVVAVADRRLSLQAAMAGLVFAACAVAALAIPFMDAILERIYGDWNQSISFRATCNIAALKMWEDGPLFGIGLNNFTNGLERHAPFFHDMVIELDRLRGGAVLRAMAPVHNVYLLVLSEAGMLGLAGFVVLLLAILARMLRAFLISAGAVRGIFLGLSVGMIVQFVQQQVDFSLWLDPAWYTLALLMALTGSVRTLRPVLR